MKTLSDKYTVSYEDRSYMFETHGIFILAPRELTNSVRDALGKAPRQAIMITPAATTRKRRGMR